MRHKIQCIFFTLQINDNDEYVFSYISDNVSDILQVSSGDILKNSSIVLDMIHEGDKAQFFEDLRESRKNLEPVQLFLRFRIDQIIYYSEIRLTVKNTDHDLFSWDGVFIDTSEMKQYIPEFSRHLDFELLISSISTEFIGFSIDEIDDGINRALASIGSFSGSDRAYVFMIHKDEDLSDNIFEWCSDGVESEIDNLKNILLAEELPWFSEKIRKQEVVYIPDIDALPSAAKEERTYFKKQKIMSLFVVPMVLKGELFGFLGFDSIDKILNWTLSDQMLIRLCGEIFVNALNRKSGEKRISKAHRLFEAVIRQSPIPMGIAAPDGIMMIFNRACAEQLGIDYDTYINEDINLFEMDHPWEKYDVSGNVIPLLEVPLIKALQGESSAEMEVNIIREDGSQRWQITNGAPIFDENGDLIAGFTSFLDITKLKKAESALKDRIKELDCLYGISHLVEKEGITLKDILQETVNLLEDSWKYPFTVSARIVFEDKEYTGHKSKISCTSCVYNERSNLSVYGEVSGFVGVCYCDEKSDTDKDDFIKKEHNFLYAIAERLGRIIEQKQAEEALLESEAKFRSYVEYAPDAIFVADRKGCFIEVNEAACIMTEYNKDELLGFPISSITYKEDVEDALKSFQKCIKEGKSAGNFRYVTKSGKIRTWAVEAVKLSEERYLGFAKDITENQKMVDQLRQMDKMDAIGQLAGGIAHDFNNQIAVIMGYSEMLISYLDDPKYKHYAENILASSHRSDDLTRKLLAFAHKGLYESLTVNIHKIIGEAIDILSHGINKNIAISLNFKAEPPFTIGDPSQIQNIFLNLAINARDAMPDGGEIVFETSIEYLDEEYCRTFPYDVVPGAFILISVTDNGSGIDEKNISRIFEPFFTTKELGKGTGMGLASVFGAVTNHHGVIEVNSTPGIGTTFLLYFPLSENTLVRGNKSTSFYLENGEATILLVDDDELVRQLGFDMLNNLGYQVEICKDGSEAVDYFRDNWRSIDLVILDMIMPGLGGKDVFRLMKEINPKVSVILSSGFSLSGDVQQLLNEGANAFIGKPYEIGNISEIIAKVLK